jgi:hypothetical protein
LLKEIKKVRAKPTAINVNLLTIFEQLLCARIPKV